MIISVDTRPEADLAYGVANLYYAAFHGDRKPSRDLLGSILCELESTETHGLIDGPECLLGAVSFMPDQEASHTEVKQLAVSPDRQGLGYGRALMLHVEELAIARGNIAIKLLSNGQSMSFYRKLGYRVTEASGGNMIKEIE